MTLELPALIYAAALIFARLGAILMLMPSIGEPSIPPRIRLAFALLFALALGPAIAPSLPPMPEQPMAMGGLLVSELLIGLMIGAVSRMFLSAAAIAGQVVGMQSGLAMAQSFDPTQGQQGALMGAFLNLLFIALIFATNLHHLLLQAARGSYMVFPAGEIPLIGDAAQWAVTAFVDAFRIGVQIAAPLIVFGLIFYLALGVLSRLMPQAQIFFIAMPSNILAGFFIVAISLGTMAMVWLERMERFAVEFG
ncbi:flagellar biosynthetic protein FliR [Hyphobacterium marinum]|uniref:Flagellar biosynthetic protein FliR n=1 Tax=Hyphobacterium marinum TaxID=3116574 RepID=A0ABU7LZB1_9PROT|nr:flagellar biosynthetic protein FliR [Hyphobacterium sp. Y6023]MEE2566893.1 flagellar biosynthetic protein FliR [Hyphobacterium sp. Y6023]